MGELAKPHAGMPTIAKSFCHTHVDVRTLFREEPDDRGVPILRGKEERRRCILCPGVDVSAVGKCSLDVLEVPVACRGPERVALSVERSTHFVNLTATHAPFRREHREETVPERLSFSGVPIQTFA